MFADPNNGTCSKNLKKNIQPQTENIVPTNSIQVPPPKSSTKNVTLISKEKLTSLIDSSTSKLILPKHQQYPSSGFHTSVMAKADPSPSATCKKGSATDPISIETLSMEITDLRTPLCTNRTSQMATTFQSASATFG